MPEFHLNPKKERCCLCGEIALGHAYIMSDRYCHGDSQRPSCYEKVLRGIA